MKLPLRDFADVITAMKGPGDKAAGAEKRSAARMTVNAKINLHLIDNDRVVRSFSALTRDISITGMGVLQSVALSSGQNVVVALPRPQSPLFVICSVMHCRPLADGVLAVGLEFAELATKETCDLLLNNATQQHAKIRDSVLR
jgi:hypothetical protein